MSYTQTYTSERAEAERRQAQELSDAFKELEQWQSCFRLRLEHWCRHGPSKATREQIDEAAAECGSRITKIMNSPTTNAGQFQRRVAGTY
jgi:hypothetical protein